MKPNALYRGHRFPAAIISQAVRWYFRFQLSLRDIEELLFERGVIVSYETIRRWCEKFGAAFARRIKAARRKPGRIWHLDEMFVYLRGEPWLLWRAVDEHGAELDILLQKQRDKAAAKRFFQRVLRTCPVPRKIVTDQLCSYPAAKADIPELANVKHVFVKAGARVNNRAENSHQPTRECERRMRGFRDPMRTQAFLESFGLIRQHFALKRHLLRASLYRKHLAVRFSTWCELVEVTQNPSAA
ncbi:IS6 family transposase [Burkholderia gladioli]|uniref:IS6 family transposase n=1 Tax=Burkholderia gladioli TaxID=28095 RepID=A0A095FTK4_BURGA|nr:IS6 family transposase [Burkholderia gladioli]ATF90566.1 IS6 family transposase [Burkholderia gladioli pv. gladioli]KGC20330.1 transposase IS66 family protein [Burkholderia gladioli]MBJ9711256.1 IS6 family transposase [Burkholderia gladioli]MCH7273554.1 IS6 family transposase [Burkholderia gladioli]MDN7499532.1 IS6 family transposase [Burkholderia gladioli]